MINTFKKNRIEKFQFLANFAMLLINLQFNRARSFLIRSISRYINDI